MAGGPLPTPEQVRQMVRYEPESGTLIWLARTPDMIRSANPRERIGKSARWNKLFEGRTAGRVGSNGYFYIMIGYRMMLLHRVIWAVVHNAWPTGTIDHIDGNKANNRVANLRDVGHENYRNQKRWCTNTSGVSGVRFDKARKKWRGTIIFQNKTYNLGSFSRIEDAAAAVTAKRREFGGFTERHGT